MSAHAAFTEAAWNAETTPRVISTAMAPMNEVATMPAVNIETVARVAMATPAVRKLEVTCSISVPNRRAVPRASTSPRVKSVMSSVRRVLRSGMFVAPATRTPPSVVAG